MITWRHPTILVVLAAAHLPGLRTALGASEEVRDDSPVGFPAVFFPPAPPIYGTKVAEQPAGTSRIFGGRRLTAPDGLADFAGEIFFPPLGTRLFSRALNPKLETRLEQYRARRNALVNALLDQCVTLHDSPAETKEQELRTLAATQTPQIVALETEADTLRRDLIRGGLGQGIDWNAQRRWALDTFPPATDWANKEAEFQVVRAAAYYQDGLIPTQRGLLCELAMELETTARKARAEPVARGESDAMFFSPETSRLRLPPELPPPVLARIAAYNAQKAALKRELRDAVHAQEKVPAARRTAAFARLADDQWPHLGNLEVLAEEIRRDLVQRFEPAAPKRPPAIPSWLVDSIQVYNEERDSYFGELREKLRAAVDLVPRPERNTGSDEQVQRQQEFLTRQTEARRQATLEFQEAHAARFDALDRQYRSIRRALETIAKTATDAKTGRRLDVEALLQQHGASVAEFDGFGRAIAIYANYRIAMLQPGLSPEQRRLLFGYAVAALAQPLPYGELLPPRAAKFPLPR